ncbi:MAG TPA: FIST N-terminal domain-containing protein [Polyangia bacterium]|nr:FIST N-terminal domain-containing protein [Polyangia bacterium]
MKISQVVLKELEAAPLDALAALDPQLVLAFGSPAFFGTRALPEALTRAFPRAHRVGCTTAGEIAGSTVGENSLVLTAIAFEHASFATAHVTYTGTDGSREAGRGVARELARPGLTAMVVLGPGVDVNGSDVIAGILDVAPNVTVTGGLAGDYGAFRETFVLHDDTLLPRAVVAIGFYGDAVRLSSGSSGGWKSFGPTRCATRASGNILHELDGQPALDVYKRYLGPYADDLPSSGLLFPFALLDDERHESGIIRTPLAVDERAGTITLAGDVPQGGLLRLMHATSELLVDGAETAARDAIAPQPRGGDSLALLVSCVGRKLLMGDGVDAEVEAVGALLGERCTLAGFYSNGEIAPIHGETAARLHNQTMTITYLTES